MKIFVFFVFLSVATAQFAQIARVTQQFNDNPVYAYSYSVNDDLRQVYINKNEERSGDAVSGSYSYVDPAGTRRTVSYTANDATGYLADVNEEVGAVQIRQQPATVAVQQSSPVRVVQHSAPVRLLQHQSPLAFVSQQQSPVRFLQQPAHARVVQHSAPVRFLQQPTHHHASVVQHSAPVRFLQQPAHARVLQHQTPFGFASQPSPVHFLQQPAPVSVLQHSSPVRLVSHAAAPVAVHSPFTRVLPSSQAIALHHTAPRLIHPTAFGSSLHIAHTPVALSHTARLLGPFIVRATSQQQPRDEEDLAQEEADPSDDVLPGEPVNTIESAEESDADVQETQPESASESDDASEATLSETSEDNISEFDQKSEASLLDTSVQHDSYGGPGLGGDEQTN